MKIETIAEKVIRTKNTFRFYTWYHMQCKNGLTIWTEKYKKDETECPGCREIVKINQN